MNQQPTIEERLGDAKQAMRDVLHVLSRNIEDMEEYRARLREALEELEEAQP